VSFTYDCYGHLFPKLTFTPRLELDRSAAEDLLLLHRWWLALAMAQGTTVTVIGCGAEVECHHRRFSPIRPDWEGRHFVAFRHRGMELVLGSSSNSGRLWGWKSGSRVVPGEMMKVLASIRRRSDARQSVALRQSNSELGPTSASQVDRRRSVIRDDQRPLMGCPATARCVSRTR